MAGENLSLNLFCGRSRSDSAMKTDDTQNIRPAAGKFKRRGPAEAITNRGDALGIGRRQLLELVQASGDAPAEQVAIAFVFAGFGRGVRWIVRANAFAVNVCGENVIAKCRKQLGALVLVMAQSL